MDSTKLNKISDDIKESQKIHVKELVTLTFEKVEALEAMKAKIMDQLKILKHDLFDLKDGRLDRILERQNMNAETCVISAIKVQRKEGQTSNNPWFTDYEVSYTCNGTSSKVVINNSAAKTHASGTYKLQNDSIKYL